MTRMDKHRAIFQSEVGKIGEQKRHPVRSALKNGGSNRTRIPDLLQISPRARRLWRQKRQRANPPFGVKRIILFWN